MMFVHNFQFCFCYLYITETNLNNFTVKKDMAFDTVNGFGKKEGLICIFCMKGL